MKAIVWTQYGSADVLQLQEVEKPAPKDNEVLIKIYATTATAGDCEMRGLSGARWYTLLIRAYVGLRKPKRITILGMELAGEVESVGKGANLFKAGDQVFAATGFAIMFRPALFELAFTLENRSPDMLHTAVMHAEGLPGGS